MYDEPKKPRIFVTGSSGFLGSHLCELYHKRGFYIFEAHHFQIRLEHPGRLQEILKRLRPDRILHLAAETDPLRIETERGENVNVSGTACLAEAAEALEIPVIFISTDRVFDGRSDRPYTEKDRPRPACALGRQKLRGEEIIRNANLPSWHILRIPPVWSEHLHPRFTRQNFLAPVVRAFEGESGRWPRDITGGLLHWRRLADLLEQLPGIPSGIYHLSSDTEKNYWEQARYFAAFLGPSPEMITDTIRPDDSPPQNFRLNSSKLFKTTGFSVPSMEKDVKTWIHQIH